MLLGDPDISCVCVCVRARLHLLSLLCVLVCAPTIKPAASPLLLSVREWSQGCFLSNRNSISSAGLADDARGFFFQPRRFGRVMSGQGCRANINSYTSCSCCPLKAKSLNGRSRKKWSGVWTSLLGGGDKGGAATTMDCLPFGHVMTEPRRRVCTHAQRCLRARLSHKWATQPALKAAVASAVAAVLCMNTSRFFLIMFHRFATSRVFSLFLRPVCHLLSLIITS